MTEKTTTRQRGPVLVVEDEAYVRDSLVEILRSRRFEASPASSVTEALEHLDFAIELKPEHSRAWYNRATLHLKMGDTVSALADYTTAIRLNPSNADAYTGRGAILRVEGDLDGALDDFSRAIELARAGATKEAVADATGLSLEEAEAIVTFHGRNSG